MKFDKNLHRHIEEAIRLQIPCGTRGSIELQVRPWTFQIQIQDSDRLSLMIQHLTLRVHLSSSDEASWDRFLRWVMTWVEHIHYLAEPLAIVEQEPREWKILVRSTPPSPWPGGQMQYHEIWWKGGNEQWMADWSRIGVEVSDARKEIAWIVPRSQMIQCFYDTCLLWAHRERWKRG